MIYSWVWTGCFILKTDWMLRTLGASDSLPCSICYSLIRLPSKIDLAGYSKWSRGAGMLQHVWWNHKARARTTVINSGVCVAARTQRGPRLLESSFKACCICITGNWNMNSADLFPLLFCNSAKQQIEIVEMLEYPEPPERSENKLWPSQPEIFVKRFLTGLSKSHPSKQNTRW